MANYRFPNGSRVALTLTTEVSDNSYNLVTYNWYKRVAGSEDGADDTLYQRTQGSKTSRIVVTETADYWCLVEHETAGSAISNIAEIEFQPPAAFLTFTRKAVNNDTSNLVTERIHISEYDDGVTLFPSKARTGAKTNGSTGTPYQVGKYNGEAETRVVPTESNVNVEVYMGGGNGNCYKRGSTGGEGGRGGTAYCYFTMLKGQEYTVKLAATDWASIGYNTGNSLYGPQSTPTGMKDNEGGLGGGMSIIYIGNRVFAVCGGGGGGGKEGNGGDGGGCNVAASNGDGPSHGYGSNLSSAGEYRNGARYDSLWTCPKNDCGSATFRNGASGRGNAAPPSGSSGGGGGGGYYGGGGSNGTGGGGGGSGWADDNIVLVDNQQGGHPDNPRTEINSGEGQFEGNGFAVIKIYTGDLLDGITFTSPTLVSRPAETTFQRGGRRGGGGGGGGGRGGGRQTSSSSFGGRTRGLAEAVAQIYGYSSYTTFHNNVQHNTYDKQSLVDLAAAKGWTVVG